MTSFNTAIASATELANSFFYGEYVPENKIKSIIVELSDWLLDVTLQIAEELPAFKDKVTNLLTAVHTFLKNSVDTLVDSFDAFLAVMSIVLTQLQPLLTKG